jgi:DNA-binding beta-propeller fold protein YncE
MHGELTRRGLIQGAAAAVGAVGTGTVIGGTLAAGPVAAAATPVAAPFTGTPIIAHTAFVANEATGTVSVIDTRSHRITSTIGLGSDPAIAGTPQPNGPLNAESDHHKPFYDGHVAPHGLWLTPDAAVLLVTCRISGTVVAVDTLTQRVLGYTPVGREPHLATVHPNGSQAWVAIRGEDYVEVLKLDRGDLHNSLLKATRRMASVALVDTAEGPSMVAFDRKGTSAFVAMGKESTVQKVSVSGRRLLLQRPVPAPFTPFGMVTPDGSALYLVHKARGTVSVLSTQTLEPLVPELTVGPRANHVEFLGGHAYVAVGGPAPDNTSSDPQGKIVVMELTGHTKVGEVTGPDLQGEPHAMWAISDDELYLGHERGNRVSILNVSTPARPRVVGLVTGSAANLSFLRQPIDVVAATAHTH